jgi:ABC-type sugar transport system permease subunit
MSTDPAIADLPATAGLRAPSGRFARWSHRRARWLFPAPAVLLVAAIIVYPIVYTVWMSLQDWFASSLTLPKFIGLANYQKILFGDALHRRVHHAVEQNGRIMAPSAPLGGFHPDHILHVLNGFAVPLVIERREMVSRGVPLLINVSMAP